MSKGHAKFLVVTAAVLIASCLDFDDPLTVDPASVDPAEIEESMAMASGASQSAIPPLKESFRARFRIDFSVAGSALVPNSPITVTINGVANEALTSGTVEVTLPTQASMAHAGDGKRLGYPQGQKFPVVASWQLPAMSKGESWSRTFSTGSVDKGYYQIAATVTTERPANGAESFVANDMSREIWMLVNTDGGSSTGVFDESVIPAGFRKSARPVPHRRDLPGQDTGPSRSLWRPQERGVLHERLPVAQRRLHAQEQAVPGAGSQRSRQHD